jgi:tetratricopeptide (TPR) repeat protein
MGIPWKMNVASGNGSVENSLKMTRKAAEYYHMHAEESLEKEDHRTAATAYFEAASQYKEIGEHATALTLFENAAQQALEEEMTETAAQANLWAAYACHKLGNSEYFLTCAKNMGELYSQASEKALEDGNPQRTVIDLSLAAMAFATIEQFDTAGERIEKAKRVVDKTREEWLRTLLSFSEALTEAKLIEANNLLKSFEKAGNETIQEVMKACLDIREEEARKKG